MVSSPGVSEHGGTGLGGETDALPGSSQHICKLGTPEFVIQSWRKNAAPAEERALRGSR